MSGMPDMTPMSLATVVGPRTGKMIIVFDERLLLSITCLAPEIGNYWNMKKKIAAR